MLDLVEDSEDEDDDSILSDSFTVDDSPDTEARPVHMAAAVSSTPTKQKKKSENEIQMATSSREATPSGSAPHKV